MYAKQKQVLESFVRVRTFLEDHPATGSIILEDLLRRICRSRARAPHTSTGFRTLLDRWQSQRLALLNQHRHDELVEHWPARFDACAGRLVRDAA